MDGTELDFERPILELERRIDELRGLTPERAEAAGEIRRLEERLRKLTEEIFSKLTPWQNIQLARHPYRPHTMDYIKLMFNGFVELHGDRSFRDDRAIVGGLAKFGDQSLVVLGHQKGKSTEENLACNFGMPHPEGYRKALRLMKLGEKFNLPLVTFIDTPGAYPGLGAEERGQSQIIAQNLKEMSKLTVPICVVIIGEGGSGGALAIGVGDRVLMFEHAIYSVISPEGCATILWRDSSKAPEAAKALRLTAQDLLELKVIDEVVPEPPGGAHRDHDQAAMLLADALRENLRELNKYSREELVAQRYAKYRRMGEFLEKGR